MKRKKKIVTLLLDTEVVDWLEKEAEQDGKTLDEVVNNRLLCLRFVNSLDEEDFDNLLMVMGSKKDGGVVS